MEKMYTIESEFIRADISTKGAVVSDLYDVEIGREYTKHLQGLTYFPNVGKLREDYYLIGNKKYSLLENGLANDRNFTVVSYQKDAIILRLESDDMTLKSFPYEFQLDITYRVYGPRLTVSFEVKNLSRREMLFSMGSTIPFSLPLGEGKFEDYYLEFVGDHPFSVNVCSLEKKLVSFHHLKLGNLMEDKALPLSDRKLLEEYLIFKDIYAEKIMVKNRSDGSCITIEFSEFPYVSFFAKRGDPFLHIGVWQGIPDHHGSNHDFYEKEGLLVLDAGKAYQAEFSIVLN